MMASLYCHVLLDVKIIINVTTSKYWNNSARTLLFLLWLSDDNIVTTTSDVPNFNRPRAAWLGWCSLCVCRYSRRQPEDDDEDHSGAGCPLQALSQSQGCRREREGFDKRLCQSRPSVTSGAGPRCRGCVGISTTWRITASALRTNLQARCQ